MPPTACPLCNRFQDRGVVIEGKGDAVSVACPRCGEFTASNTVLALLEDQSVVPQRWRLSTATRRASDAGRRLTLRSDSLDAVAAQVTSPRGPIEAVDSILVAIRDAQEQHQQYVRINPDDFSAVLGVPDGDAVTYYLKAGKSSLGYIESKDLGGSLAYRPSINGWKRLDAIRRLVVRSSQAFVAMSFHPDLDPAYTEGLKPGIVAAGYDPLRVKDEETGEKIDDLIIREIRRSAILVADFTLQRQNVYYEAGFADGLGIPVIRTVRRKEEKKLHFDTRQYGHVVWDEPEDLREKIRNRLDAVVPLSARVRP